MSVSIIRRVSIRSALTLVLVSGSANADAYSWTEIVVPSIGPIGSAAGINDKGQLVVGSADNSKWGIYRNGIFTPLPALPAGYKVSLVWGINNSGIIVGGAFPPTDPTHEQGFILVGSKYTLLLTAGLEQH